MQPSPPSNPPSMFSPPPPLRILPPTALSALPPTLVILVLELSWSMLVHGKPFPSPASTSRPQNPNNYSAFDQELLAVYLAVHWFQSFIEGFKCLILTHHKPHIHASLPPTPPCNPSRVLAQCPSSHWLWQCHRRWSLSCTSIVCLLSWYWHFWLCLCSALLP